MPSREGLRENPKASMRKEAQNSALLRKQKQKSTPSDDSVDGNSTDSDFVVLQAKKKCSKHLQHQSVGGDNCSVSDSEVVVTDTPGPEIEEVMLKKVKTLLHKMS